MHRSIPLLAVAALAAATAHAQVPVQTGPSPTSGSDQGYFRPQADPALTSPAAPLTTAPAPAFLAPAQGGTPATPAGTTPMPQQSVIGPTGSLILPQGTPGGRAPVNAPGPVPAAVPPAEEQLDRSQQEADRARALGQGPQPVNGAFTGLTSERDR